MDIEYIKEFIMLSKLLNFSKAADRLHISQPTLSRHLSLLEEELDTCLMIRSRHSVYLTEKGKLFLPKAIELLEKYNETLIAIKIPGLQEKRTLGLGILYYQKKFLLEKVELFKHKYPDVETHYLSATPGELVVALLEETIDIAATMHFDFKYSETLSLLLIVSPAHRFAERSCISMREIAEDTLINVDDMFYHGYFNYIRSLCQIHSIHLTKPKLVPDYETMLIAVESGQGIAVITDNMKRHLTGCVPIDILEDNFVISRSIVWRTNTKNRAVHQFIRLLE